MPLREKIVNALLFNLAWLLCVKGGDVIALSTACIVTLIHIAWVGRQVKELVLIFIVVLIGFIVDSLLIYWGIMRLADGSHFPPLWLISLWVVFANTLNGCLHWFQSHLTAAVVLGGFFGATSYLVGAMWAGVNLIEPGFIAFILLFGVWAALFPALMFVARYFSVVVYRL